MPISVATITRTRGDTSIFQIIITSDGTAPIDITGFSYLFTVDPSAAPKDSANNLFQLSVGTGLTISDGPNGIIDVGLSPTQADQIPDVYHHECQQTDTGGLIHTVLRGPYEVEADISM